VWDVSSGKPLSKPMRHEDRVFSAAFSPDGTRVVTASYDKTARVWEASSGKPLGEPMRYSVEVRSAAFSPDGTRVVTANGEPQQPGFALMWDVSLPAPTRPNDDFLSQLDELVADRHFDAGGAIAPLDEEWLARRRNLRQAIAAPASPPALAKAIGWYLADARHRTISPLSGETTAEWLRRRDDEFTPESLQAAWEVDPADPLCLARRARNFALGADPDSYWADLYSKLAMKLAPGGAEAA
jgi:dipeptidyl aminopeptidase/acylaminoacyl peptidase